MCRLNNRINESREERIKVSIKLTQLLERKIFGLLNLVLSHFERLLSMIEQSYSKAPRPVCLKNCLRITNFDLRVVDANLVAFPLPSFFFLIC